MTRPTTAPLCPPERMWPNDRTVDRAVARGITGIGRATRRGLTDGGDVPRLFAPSFSAFNRAAIRPDLIAGLTVWAVLVPESLAYTTIAGVPPVVGLCAAVSALTIYAVIGSSRHLVVSPMWSWTDARRRRSTSPPLECSSSCAPT